MKSVYEASTTLDAHMILNLLAQEGIQGRVDGEYLPGGVGELQAMNLVRVMVDESDCERAGQIISNWETIQVDNEEKENHKVSSGVPMFFLGLVIGGGLVFWAYSTPVTEDGIDYNGDGVLDEKWIFRDNRLSKTEIDRDYDGQVDIVYNFDRRGITKRAKFDDNFDGVFETTYKYRNGLPRSQESDFDQDGSIDYMASYKYGNLDEVIILGMGRDARRKVQKYEMWKLISSEFDSNGDGIYNVMYEYDYFEDVAKKREFKSEVQQ